MNPERAAARRIISTVIVATGLVLGARGENRSPRIPEVQGDTGKRTTFTIPNEAFPNQGGPGTVGVPSASSTTDENPIFSLAEERRRADEIIDKMTGIGVTSPPPLADEITTLELPEISADEFYVIERGPRSYEVKLGGSGTEMIGHIEILSNLPPNCVTLSQNAQGQRVLHRWDCRLGNP